jgi:hypothetical protein
MGVGIPTCGATRPEEGGAGTAVGQRGRPMAIGGRRVCARCVAEQGRVGVADPWAPAAVLGGGSLNLFQIQFQNEFESDSNCFKLCQPRK